MSCTTRSPRNGERDGVDYHFLTRDEFLRAASCEVISPSRPRCTGTCTERCGARSPGSSAAGRHVVMDIDVQGARQFGAGVSAVGDRLRAPAVRARCSWTGSGDRKTESPEQLVARLHSALQELRAVEEYEYVVVNDDLEQAVQRVGASSTPRSSAGSASPGCDTRSRR